jgi:hypothetical protein
MNDGYHTSDQWFLHQRQSERYQRNNTMTTPVNDQPTGQQATSIPAGPLMHALMRYAINPAVSGLLRSPLRGGLANSMLLITFTGRKSGKRYSTPVAYFEEKEELIVFTRAPWWKNLAGGAEVTLHLRGRSQKAHAEALSEPKEIVEGYLV